MQRQARLMTEDKKLVGRFNRGDRQALQRIYEKYREDLLKVAASLLIVPSQGEDVLHDVFVSFARQSGRFKPSGSLKGYLAIGVAKRARDCNRRLHFPAEADEDALKTHVRPLHGPAQQAVCRELQHQVAAAVEALPEDQREVIVLHLQCGLRFREIARAKDVALPTIQSRYRYGLAKLRSALNGERPQ